MTDSGSLNKESKLHMFILHYAFLPRINQSIQLFTNSWNHHPLRTERNKSPIQIWQNSMLDILDYNTEFC